MPAAQFRLRPTNFGSFDRRLEPWSAPHNARWWPGQFHNKERPVQVESIKIDACGPEANDGSVTDKARAMWSEIQAGIGAPDPTVALTLSDGGSFSSPFAVSDLAQASVAAAGTSLAALMALDGGGATPGVTVDRELASAWFRLTMRPQGWELPPMWDAVAGDYATSDGWIKLHTNAPRHRAAALAVLGTPGDRAAVSEAVRSWKGEELEEAVVATGGAAAAMRSVDEWRNHPQGRAVSDEPLLHLDRTAAADRDEPSWGRGDRPLAGLRVLDLTRILAGPVATRLLAGWGAEVLRIDPPHWDEPTLAPEVTLGKRCARLDLATSAGRESFLELLGDADVLVHGYRSDALDNLGLGAETRAAARPGLVDVSLDAYGWSGPWVTRRGYDSLVQMSSGIADAGRRAGGGETPVSLPAQALDHGTGYLLAAAVLRGLALRTMDGRGSRWRASLARTASLLIGAGFDAHDDRSDRPLRAVQAAGPVEHTAWGDIRRLPAPLKVDGAPLHWSLPARPLGTDEARWSGG